MIIYASIFIFYDYLQWLSIAYLLFKVESSWENIWSLSELITTILNHCNKTIDELLKIILNDKCDELDQIMQQELRALKKQKFI